MLMIPVNKQKPKQNNILAKSLAFLLLLFRGRQTRKMYVSVRPLMDGKKEETNEKRGVGRPPKPLPEGVAPNAFALWLYRSGTSVADICRILGVKSASVYGWRRGNRPPSRPMAAAIARLSNGEVPADSWD